MSEENEYKRAWNERLQTIDVAISDILIRGYTPDILIANTQTLQQLCDYLELQPDWANPDGRTILFGDDGEVPLRIFRSVDVPYGQIIVR